LPVLEYLTAQLFPFNYVVPRESTNTIFHFRSYCERHPHLMPMVPEFQADADDALLPGDNRFSSPSYRVIHFVADVPPSDRVIHYVADVPVRVPQHIMDLAPPGSEHLGPIVFMLCEFQILDAESEAANESGEASHEAYKHRQKQAVSRRLRLGGRPPPG
jgi:hypothetical protein